MDNQNEEKNNQIIEDILHAIRSNNAGHWDRDNMLDFVIEAIEGKGKSISLSDVEEAYIHLHDEADSVISDLHGGMNEDVYQHIMKKKRNQQ